LEEAIVSAGAALRGNVHTSISDSEPKTTIERVNTPRMPIAFVPYAATQVALRYAYHAVDAGSAPVSIRTSPSAMPRTLRRLVQLPISRRSIPN